jgi:ADP-ribose pyrophosphatase YjhB (NUDIX family)
MQAYSHCNYCGNKYPDNQAGPGNAPLNCKDCGQTTWISPSPVAVCVTPITSFTKTGLLTVTRKLDPQGLALPGGFIEQGETAEAAASRELKEETALTTDPTKSKIICSAPTKDKMLVFVQTEPIEILELDNFQTNDEITGIKVVSNQNDLEEVVFPLHKQIAEAFFHRYNH